MKTNNLLLATLLLLSIAMGVVEFILNSLGESVTEKTQTIWGVVFIFISIMWASYDSKQSGFAKPFDFGFLMYIFWPIAFPYYLVTTRGFEGILYVVGFLSLWGGPWLAGLVAYVYVYSG